MVISGSTRLAAVIGSPVQHSLSPAIYNAAFQVCQLDWVYVALEVRSGGAAQAVDGARAMGFAGLSVTMPHKQDVARAVDQLTPAAEVLGAVNCVARSPAGALIGHNTDGAGFVDSLRADGFDPGGWRVVVLGAGGAARSVIVALADAGASEVVVVNRSQPAAASASELAGPIGRVGRASDVVGADLVVHATPVGMLSSREPLPLEADWLRPGQVVADLVYHPRDTPLLQEARHRGAVAIGGLGMLVHQAAHQFTLWTDQPAPIDAMRAAAEHALR
jgi:shikimate dehydrogenase